MLILRRVARLLRLLRWGSSSVIGLGYIWLLEASSWLGVRLV